MIQEKIIEAMSYGVKKKENTSTECKDGSRNKRSVITNL